MVVVVVVVVDMDMNQMMMVFWGRLDGDGGVDGGEGGR